jgi:hypothetical protein
MNHPSFAVKAFDARVAGMPQPTAVQPMAAQFPASELSARVDLVLSRLPKDAPFYQPKHIAPELGITADAFTKHCRNARHLQTWRGSYRFHTDDPGHMEALRKVLRVALWSGLKLPDDLRPPSASRSESARPMTHRAPRLMQ